MKDVYNISKNQYGNHNSMYNDCSFSAKNLDEQYWEELKTFLETRLSTMQQESPYYNITKKALDYSEKRDNHGFIRLVNANKEAFFTNVMSDVASSGLLYALNKIFI